MANEFRSANRESQEFEISTSGMLRNLVRLVCLMVGMAVLGVGVYFGWRVFEHVESVVTQGIPLEAAVDRIADIIEAEKIVIDDPQRGIKAEFGRSLAVGLVWMFYLVWTWIALGFIKAGGSLLLSSVSEKGDKQG